MRGKITDQDLTNYALNDGLEPSERLYVESMLAISEECRQDIYRNIEMSQMLETGFERLHGAAPMLTAEQREAQRRSFAYGNTAFENSRITREMINEQAEKLAKADVGKRRA